MRILLVGDTHGQADNIGKVFVRAKEAAADVIFQLGDFGYGWAWTKDGNRRHCRFSFLASQYAEQSGISCYWLGGNHENYDALDALVETTAPTERGTYAYLPGIEYVPRGLMLEFDGKKFLCCGGACSIDQQHRHPYVSYWPQELITQEDVNKCAAQGRADVLLTHDFPVECKVVPPIDPSVWGHKSAEETHFNRVAISNILKACRAPVCYHGHLHRRYDETIICGKQKVEVHGIDQAAAPIGFCTYLLDTENL